MSATDEITYRVDGMSCAHCTAAVTEEVERVPGVESADVNLRTKLVRVTGARVDRKQVMDAINKAGYEAVAP